MADVLRLLALDGPVVGVSLVGVLVWLGVTLTTVRSELRDFKAEMKDFKVESGSELREFKAENQTAHEGIARRLDRLAEEVAFLRGRQHRNNEAG